MSEPDPGWQPAETPGLVRLTRGEFAGLTIGVSADDSWSVVTSLTIADEHELVLLSAHGVTATVRLILDPTPHLRGQVRVRVVNDAAQSRPCAGLRLVMTPADPRWSVRVWGGGSRGFLLADGGGTCLIARQIHGWAESSDDALVPGLSLFRQTTLTPAGEPGSSASADWQIETIEQPRAVMNWLPLWWPERLVRSAGDPIVLGDDRELVTSADTITVPDERGETVLTVVTEPSFSELVSRHLPATGEPIDPAGLVIAQAARLLGLATGISDDQRLGWAEAGLARGQVPPLAVVAAARELLQQPAQVGLAESLIDALPRLRPVPGQVVAALLATVALTVAGITVQPLRPPDSDEAALVLGGNLSAAHRQLAGLGAGLPGVSSTDPLTIAVTVAAVGFASDAVLRSDRWAAPAQECARQAAAAVMAVAPSAEVVAWLAVVHPTSSA